MIFIHHLEGSLFFNSYIISYLSPIPWSRDWSFGSCLLFLFYKFRKRGWKANPCPLSHSQWAGKPGLEPRSWGLEPVAFITCYTCVNTRLCVGHFPWREIQYSKSPTYEPSSCELSKMRTCIPSTSGVSEIAACPSSPIADDPSALPSPTSSPPPVSNSSCLFTRCQALYASRYTVLLPFSRYCAVRLKMFSLFLCLFCVCFVFVLYFFFCF